MIKIRNHPSTFMHRMMRSRNFRVPLTLLIVLMITRKMMEMNEISTFTATNPKVDNLIGAEEIPHRFLCAKLMISHPTVQLRRNLAATEKCMSYWPEGTGALASWESRFLPTDKTEDIDRVWPVTSVAYAIPFMTCPEVDDLPGVDSQHDAENAFYDAAVLLKNSVCTNSKEDEDSESEYTSTMYAIIHPDAVTCTGPNGEQYDRARVLQSLDYWVKIWDVPVAETDLEGQPYLVANVENDVGLKDLIKLNALKLTQHEIVVLLDPTFTLKEPLDTVLDGLKYSDKKAAYVIDPTTGCLSTTMIAMKTSEEIFDELVETYKTVVYDETTGWGGSGIGLCDGGMGTSGLLQYYFSDGSATQLNQCIFANEANPDCKDTDFNNIVGYRMSDLVCDQPWTCSYDDRAGSWDASTQGLCEQFFFYWSNQRSSFEQNNWSKEDITSDGTHYPNIYNGYCQASGEAGYNPMINALEPTLEICGTGGYTGCEASLSTESTVPMGGGSELGHIMTQPDDCSVFVADNDGEGALVIFGGTTVARETTVTKDTSIVFVIDRSGSTCDSNNLGCSSDENYDLQYDDVLDCEIAAVLDLIAKVRTEGTVKDVGLVSFSHDLGSGIVASTLELPLTDIDIPDGDTFHAIEDSIRQINCGGATNYAAAVEKACEAVDQSTTDNNVVVFISDGLPTRGGVPGGYCTKHAIFHTIALGPKASCDSDYGTSLQSIATDTSGTCQEVPVIRDIRVALPAISDAKVDSVRGSVVPSSIKVSFGCSDVPDWRNLWNMGCDFYSIANHCQLFGDHFANMGHTGNTACCACGGGESLNVADLDTTEVSPGTYEYLDSYRLPPGQHEVCTTVKGSSVGIPGADQQCKKVYICPNPNDGIPG